MHGFGNYEDASVRADAFVDGTGAIYGAFAYLRILNDLRFGIEPSLGALNDLSSQTPERKSLIMAELFAQQYIAHDEKSGVISITPEGQAVLKDYMSTTLDRFTPEEDNDFLESSRWELW